MRKTCFVYKTAGIGSAEVRGVQVAAALGCDVMRLKHFTPDHAARYDAIVYVKWLPPPATMEAVRRRGVLQVVDALDNYSRWQFRRRAEWIDAFIASNFTHAVHLERAFGRPAVEIPHHHCNFEERRIPAGRTPPALAFVGNPKHWRQNRRMVAGLRYPLLSSPRYATREELVEIYLQADIGFAWRSEASKRSFNSAVKLVNYMSFGIPAVLGQETGYLQVARHGEECLFAQTLGEARMLLDHLARDADLRRRMGEAAFEAARPFHIRRVVERYRSLLSTL